MKLIYKKIVALLLSFVLITTYAMEKPEEHEKSEILSPNFPEFLNHKPLLEGLKIAQKLDFSGSMQEIDSYLQKLQFLTNLLYMRHEALPFFQKMLAYGKEAAASSFPYEIKGCDVTSVLTNSEKKNKNHPYYQKTIPNTPKNEPLLKKMIPITTAEGRAITFQLMPLTHNNNKKMAASNEFRCKQLLNRLMNNTNEEIKNVAKRAHNYYYTKISIDEIKKFLFRFYISLLLIDDRGRHSDINIDDVKKILQESNSHLKIEESLKKHKIYPFIKEIMPQILSLFEQLNGVLQGYGLYTDDHDVLVSSEQTRYNNHLDLLIKNIITSHSQHAILYKKLMEEKNKILKNLPAQKRLEAIKKYKTKILDRTALTERLPEKLETLYPTSTPSDNKWIGKKYHAKKKETQPTAKKKKEQKQKSKKNATQPCVQTNQEYQIAIESPIIETIEQKKELNDLLLPNYHARILRWFDPEFIAAQQPNQSSIEYHTINPLIDHFLISLGESREDIDKKTITHTLYGEIKYRSGKHKMVCFCCALNNEGVCYHRGYDILDKVAVSDVLIGNAYNVQFPLMNENIYESKKIDLSSYENIPSRTYQENQFCIRLSDPKNTQIQEIILYKPLVI